MGLISKEYAGFSRWASSHRAAYSATKASRLDSFALSRRFLGRLQAPVKPVQAYVQEHQPVNTANFQIPQRRRRIILLAARPLLQKPFLFNLEVPQELPDARTISVQEAIAHLPPLLSGQAASSPPNHVTRYIHQRDRDRVSRIPPGHPNKALPNHMKRARDQRVLDSPTPGFSDTYTRMAADQPAPTITTRFLNISNGRYGHYDELQARGISLREGARLQSFRDDYEFLSKNADTNAAMIGNAVPPALAAFMTTHLVNFWYANQPPQTRS